MRGTDIWPVQNVFLPHPTKDSLQFKLFKNENLVRHLCTCILSESHPQRRSCYFSSNLKQPCPTAPKANTQQLPAAINGISIANDEAFYYEIPFTPPVQLLLKDNNSDQTTECTYDVTHCGNLCLIGICVHNYFNLIEVNFSQERKYPIAFHIFQYQFTYLLN